MDQIGNRRKVVVECGAILFDMDGTLVDSTSIVERQWKRFAEEHNLDYARIMRISHGRRNAETIREIAPHLATPEIFAQFDEAELHDKEGAVVVKGSETLLGKLAAHEWAVVTSASQALARNRLQAVHLPVPSVLIGADDVSAGKPHPEGYLAAARRLGVERTCVWCLKIPDRVCKQRTPPACEPLELRQRIRIHSWRPPTASRTFQRCPSNAASKAVLLLTFSCFGS